MEKEIQLNNIYGNLKVDSERRFEKDARDQLRAVYDCLCRCGNSLSLTEKQLTKGSIRCCGCSAKFEDLTNQVFGKLTAVKFNGFKYYESGSRSTTWICRCECGREKIALSSPLKKGESWHCGCQLKRVSNLVGQKYGKLTVLAIEGEFRSNDTLYLCECECGKKVTRKHNSLSGNKTKSCGCYAVDDLTGKEFGQLKVLARGIQTTNRGRLFWVCECSCGTVKEIDGAALKSGATISCGCYQRTLGQTRAQSRDRIKLLEEKLLYTYQRGAKARNYSFQLDEEIFFQLVHSPCHYCGKTESNESKDYYVKDVSIKYNGIDRIDNNLGYEVSNVVPCCSTCNRMKLERTKEEYMDWINRIVKNLNLGGENIE